jgi:hypothetical protein
MVHREHRGADGRIEITAGVLAPSAVAPRTEAAWSNDPGLARNEGERNMILLRESNILDQIAFAT